jgi:hypothetical protein
MAKRSKKSRPGPDSKSETPVNQLKPGQARDAATARMVVAGLTTNAVIAAEFSKFPYGDVDLTECGNALVDTAEDVNKGDLGDAEALLAAQAVTLNTIFANLAHRACLNLGQYLDTSERYMRLALKAQGQCRATLETLAAIKNPPTVFARQANITSGPQQVNNRVTLARAGNQETLPNELLEAHGERLDDGAASTTSTSDTALAPVGTVHRTAIG